MFFSNLIIVKNGWTWDIAPLIIQCKSSRTFTYILHYQATNDPHYLEVGKSVMDNLEKHARVPCGFAAIKDVTTGVHEDQ